ncbi:MAG: type II toxin-antitoxin system mRNA interferase toxin, RelE/StbE family [Candidatus Wildermuthbacteria bacterium]|nr:type II toxin-antitoxin system mRNA interferase toxin, RelE/StbE family [Candidatus Wildermuthbacteria bacterium]
MEILYSPEFKRRYQRLSPLVKKRAEAKERVFRKDPFHPQLKTHKLRGRLDNFWAFSVDYQFRIVFAFFGEKEVRFYAIGDHSLYKKF